MSLQDWKTVFELLAFVAAALFFGYKLLAGFYVLNRLTLELSCDTPASDKGLVKIAMKITNPGSATLRLTDGWLRIFELRPDGTPVDPWKEPPPNGKGKRPSAPSYIQELKLHQLDFQRVSVPPDRGGRLGTVQAEQVRQWINLEPGSTHFRRFLQRLEPGQYRIEARLVATPVFGRLLRPVASFLTCVLTLAPVSLTKHGQWVATAVVVIPNE